MTVTELIDKKESRVFKTTVGGKTYDTVVDLIGIKPLLLHDDTRMESDFTIDKTTTAITVSADITLEDADFQDRFFIFAVSQSILSKNYVVFLHDAKHRDFFLMPLPIDYKWITTSSNIINYKGLAVGADADNEFRYLSYIYDISNKIYPLNKPKAAVTTTSRIVSIPSLTNLDKDSGGINTFEKMYGDYNVQSAIRGVSTIIDLGPANALFADGKIPVYLLRQAGINYYDYVYSGLRNVADIGTKHIYLELKY